MGNELSQQNQQQDLAGNVFRENRKNLKLEEEIAQRVKFADWEKLAIPGGIYVETPLSPEKRRQLSNMHFSDYSLYPDRFSETEIPNFRRSSLSSEPIPAPVNPGTSAPSQGIHGSAYHHGTTPISKYNFRIRKSSGSENIANDIIHASMDMAPRPRSGSYSNSKLYYFDFSLIPDKDPNCTLDEQQRPNLEGRTSRRRLYSTGDVGSVEATTPLSPIEPTSPAPAQTVPAFSSTQGTIKEEDERTPAWGTPASGVPPRRRKTSAPPRFCFFDYSMIPDKDPRFVEKRTQKEMAISKD